MTFCKLELLAVALAAPTFAVAGAEAGGSGALAYAASSFIVGQTSTSISSSGGNPIYFANQPKYSGVVTLLMNEGAAGTFVCTGALLANRVSILTAGHCVSHGAGTPGPISTTAYFPNTVNPDSVVARDPTSTAIAISAIRVDPLYTGQTIDQDDLAILTLSAPAPVTAMGYSLYSGSAVSQDYNLAGYGAVSSVGGAVGANVGPGLLRQGTNTFDFTLNDPLFRGFFQPGGPGDAAGTAADTQVLVSDFDDGTGAHNAGCNLAAAFGGGGARFCNLGTGATEVGATAGDSGGPEFIDGQIAAISSFGFTFGTGVGDTDNLLDSSFGEFDGSVPTAPNRAFILSVPEPSTWALMTLGFGLLGTGVRRSRAKAALA